LNYTRLWPFNRLFVACKNPDSLNLPNRLDAINSLCVFPAGVLTSQSRTRFRLVSRGYLLPVPSDPINEAA